MKAVKGDSDSSEGRRLQELDSIRGLAAMSVVLLHFREIWKLDNPLREPWWARTMLLALRPLYSGSSAVILFFLLSGLVLALPSLRGKGQPYPLYLLRRVIRVYLPYLGALLLSVLGAAIFEPHAYHGSWAVDMWSRPISMSLVAQHLMFFGVYDWRQYDFVIWSLIQELRISLVFPFLFLVASRIGWCLSIMLGAALSVAALMVVKASSDLSPRYSLGITLHYGAFFLLGIVFASHLDAVERWWRRTTRRIHWLLGVIALAAYSFDVNIAVRLLRLLEHGRTAQPYTTTMFGNWFAACGAFGLMCIGLHATKARQLLKSVPALFLGRVSYSLYLIHPSVLFTLTFACRDRISWWAQFPLYVGTSLLLAWLFWTAVEQPCIRLSRAVSQRAGG